MAAAGDDFVSGQDLQDLYDLLDSGLLEDDGEFWPELSSAVESAVTENIEEEVTENIGEANEENLLSCHLCKKSYKYKTKRGLERHIESKHTQEGSNENTDKENTLKKLHPLNLKVMVEKCAGLLSNDLCYPEDIRNQFTTETFSFSTDESLELWNKLELIIKSYKGDQENFYSQYYGLLEDNLLPKKFEDYTVSNILLSELSNHILIHLNKRDIVASNTNVVVDTTLSEKDICSLQYLAGHIIQKFYTKIRYSKSCNTSKNQQYVSILLASKVEVDPSQRLVNIRNRGGLWLANHDMHQIFKETEIIFLKTSSSSSRILSRNEMIKMALVNHTVISCYNNICEGIDPKVEKELGWNLLEDLLKLYFTVRGFSFARDVREKYKAAKKKVKNRSLRTQIKKASSSSTSTTAETTKK